MTSGAPPVRPLDVRREQLRELGHTDAEISAIILKEVPPPQPQAAATGMTGAGGVAGQTGVMSGVLNNLSVAMALATGFLPSIATDITNLLGAHSSLHQRSRAGVFLAVKLALVAVIGFAIFQEYQQHIISATITAEEQAKKIEAERRTAEAEAAANTAKAKGVGSGPTVEELLPSMPSHPNSRPGLGRVDDQRLEALETRIDAQQANPSATAASEAQADDTLPWITLLIFSVAPMSALAAAAYAKIPKATWKAFIIMNIIIINIFGFIFAVIVDQILSGKSDTGAYAELALLGVVLTFALWGIERWAKAKAALE